MRNARSSAADRISNLPCNILENILGCLPLREAMRTSILSKDWRYRWTRRPKLEFGDNEFDYLPQNRIPKTLIYQVLLLHEGPVLKFRLCGPYWTSSDIDHCILFLTKKYVQEFTLEVRLADIYHLPSHLFTFHQLRQLSLTGCFFHPPTTFIGFKSLIHIEFHRVTLEPAILEDLISKCPLLEQLKLIYCTAFESLKIDATNLRCFEFMGKLLKSICFKNTPKLEQVKVIFDSRVLAQQNLVCSNLTKFFRYMPNLQQLNLDGWVLQYLAIGGMPESPPTALDNVKYLYIFQMWFENIEEVLGSVYLITRCPKLQDLSINASIRNLEEPVLQFIKAQTNSYGGMKLLQKVFIFPIYGDLEPQKELLRFILSSAPALEETYILNHSYPDDQMMQMIDELKQFTCPSASVRFMYEVLGTDQVTEVQ